MFGSESVHPHSGAAFTKEGSALRRPGWRFRPWDLLVGEGEMGATTSPQLMFQELPVIPHAPTVLGGLGLWS